jgi:hypothetical protein
MLHKNEDIGIESLKMPISLMFLNIGLLIKPKCGWTKK